MQWFLSIFVFFFGLCAGSFLNCVICRLGSRKSFLDGRSFCPHCKNKLSWWELIPVFSFVFLRGRCRHCRKNISWQYPLVELAAGILFFLVFRFQFPSFGEYLYFNFQSIFSSFYFWLSVCFLLIIFVYDLRHFIIPDEVLYPAIGITVFYRLIVFFQLGDFYFLLNPLLSAIAAAMFFFLLYFFSRGKWIGFGDVKLGFFMGLFLGFPNILVALFLAYLIGAIIGVALITFKRKGLKSEIPFGPFLVGGTFIALFCGQNIIYWYFSILMS